ncbi:MAG: phosphate/phosphite/phosphonate ABC transporter substrate-binding protein [bacterium]|nr:phosphate/phosphite/phosphonate ABC transporter substrate-binding protein [bacterium]
MSQSSKKSRLILASLSSMLIFTTVACGSQEAPVKVDLGRTGEPSVAGTPFPSAPPLRVAAGGIVTPREGLAYYRKMVDYLATRLGRSPQLLDRVSYQEINDMLRDGNLDMAFICSGPYVEAREEFGLEILAVPQVDGDVVYHSYFIVRADSPWQSFDDLRGKRFAITDPMSHSGCRYPYLLLARLGETAEEFFSGVVCTYAHDKSILAVASGTVDGAAVDSLIWEYMNATRPEVTRKTKIIHISPPFGIPPVVCNPTMVDADTRDQIRQLLLSMNEDSEGADILRHMRIDRFVPGDETNYESVRRFRKELLSLTGKGQP